ncbi:hypothetical protein CAPTEDRAFT_92526 [Capitella teleta]|uniref:Uncharacterized protein n=1 Tax=Capitella teleta TaxID=283909 RepID=R7TFP6_CAPTE|nr:hypothetical protein CAPTEDRAFT_92526 [Capitella teleta]|eukprot:ELT92569.1 hypothetical protein CAPTEDRAFT_92526 [Capitella teleta]
MLSRGCRLVQNLSHASHPGRCFVRNESSWVVKSPSASGPLRISDEIQEALAMKKPVVALESTIITHGMPYPENMRTALEVENTIRLHNAIPATVAILGGKIQVGIDEHEMEFLANGESKAIKTSRRDLPYVLSQGLNGGTTVSGTMISAHMAGIPIFVTGGVGGVHRGAESTMDISADLTELGRTPVAVISAGIKSILDIPRTLEYLVVIGGTNVDFTSSFGTPDPKPNGATYPGTVKQSFGGVGRNIADCLSLLGPNPPLFLSAIGQDVYAQTLLAQCAHMDLSEVRRLPSHSTATYCAVLSSSGELIYGVGDFDIHSQISTDYVSRICASVIIYLWRGNIFQLLINFTV